MIPALIVIVIAAVAILVFLNTRKRAKSAADGGPSEEMHRPRAPYREFHVATERALVYFDVPLPAGDIDPVLSDLLLREAIEVLRDKQTHGLPLGDITEVEAFGTRNGDDVAVGSIELAVPGALPEIDRTEIVPHSSTVPYDPLARLGEKGESSAPAVSRDVDTGTADAVAHTLAPLSEELTLTGRVESELRAQGLDPGTMSAGDLALGLMRLAGYTISPTGREDSYVVSTPGSRTYLKVVGHDRGDHTELHENEMKEFAAEFATSGADRGILVTEKFGPYMIYDAERRNPKCKFVTRERLQDFVDSFSMG